MQGPALCESQKFDGISAGYGVIILRKGLIRIVVAELQSSTGQFSFLRLQDLRRRTREWTEKKELEYSAERRTLELQTAGAAHDA